MSAGTAVLKDFGSVGLTGYTRCVVNAVMGAADTTVSFTFPDTFLVSHLLTPTVFKADKSATVTVSLAYNSSTGAYTATFSAAPGAGTFPLIFIGELGRRDIASENPQGTRP